MDTKMKRMYNIQDFTREHVEEATQLARMNYEEERQVVIDLPPISNFPDLGYFADFELGVVAFSEGKMVGFLSFYPPLNEVFTTFDRGTFSPIHAHGTVSENREMIYQYLYQAAAKKLMERGIIYHSIGLYAHDSAAIQAFYKYGFGLRCMDTIRKMEEIPCRASEGYCFKELLGDEYKVVHPLRNELIHHLALSPSFMKYNDRTEAEFETETSERRSRFFCAYHQEELIAFLEVTDEGENFACSDSGMKNICGAYCYQEHRGNGVYLNLLNFCITTLKAEGYTRLGVDFESFNPTASGFWLKHFTEYTHGVVRRIDDKIVKE